MPLFSAREMLFADLKFNGFSHRQWFLKKKKKKKEWGQAFRLYVYKWDQLSEESIIRQTSAFYIG